MEVMAVTLGVPTEAGHPVSGTAAGTDRHNRRMSRWGIWTWLLAMLLGAWGPVDHESSSSPELPSPTATIQPAPSLVAPGGSRAWQGFEPDVDGTLVRITIDDGYDGAQLSLSTDGRVVLVRDTSVEATRDDYVTWVVSDAALRRALRSLARVGVLDAEPGTFGEGAVSPYTRSVGVFFGQGLVISGSEESPRFAPLWRAAERLTHPASYGGDGLVSGPRAWVPDEIGLLFDRPDAANPYPGASWPFDEPIRRMAHPAPAGSQRELAVCLRGADAAKLFASLPGGVVGVFRWSDGAATWSAGVDVTTPGYSVYDGACDPV